MQALFVTSDSWLGTDLRRELASHEDAVSVAVCTQSHELLDQLPIAGDDLLLVHVASGDLAASVGFIEQARVRAPDLPIIAVLDGEGVGAAEALTAGADGFVHAGPRAAESIAAIARAVRARPRIERREKYRVLFVTRTEGFRDPTLADRFDLEAVLLLPDHEQWITVLAPEGRPFDAIVVDASTVGVEILDVVQWVITTAGDTPVIVLTDAGDRRVATAVLGLGAQQVISRSGAWPVRLAAAIEFGVASFRAMADVRESRAAEARLRAFVDALPVGLIVLDEEGRLLAVNPRAVELTGSREGTGPPNVFDLLVDEDRPLVRRLIQRVTLGEHDSIRVRWLSPDAPRWLQIDAAPFARPGAATNVFAALRVVSDAEGEIQHVRAQRDEALTDVHRAAHGYAAESNAQAVELEFAREALWKAESSRFDLEERIRELEAALSDRQALEAEVGTLRASLARARGDRHVAPAGPEVERSDAAAPVTPDAAATEAGALAVARVAPDFVREIARHVGAVRRVVTDVAAQVPRHDPRRADVKQVLARANRAHAVARQFVTYSRSRLRRPRLQPLGEVLDALRPMLYRAVGDAVRLEILPPTGPKTVYATREGLGRVLMAAVSAAADALQLGGTVTIRVVEPRSFTSSDSTGELPPGVDADLVREGGPPTDVGATAAGDMAPSARTPASPARSVSIRVGATGFRRGPLRPLTELDPLLAGWGASLTIVQRDLHRAGYELTFRSA